MKEGEELNEDKKCHLNCSFYRAEKFKKKGNLFNSNVVITNSDLICMR